MCAQIYTEARYLVFSANVFRYSDAALNVQAWAKQRPDALARIEALRLYSSGMNGEGKWLAGLKYFPALRRVEIAVSGRGPAVPESERGPWGARTWWERQIEEKVWKVVKGRGVKVEFWVTFEDLIADARGKGLVATGYGTYNESAKVR